MNNQELNRIDPIKKQADRGSVGEDLSPMAPPEAYAPPAKDQVPLEEMHPFLRKLSLDHVRFLEELKIFEDTILTIQSSGFTKDLDQRLRHFFHVFDHEFISHNRLEEIEFFPLLGERLIASGEHSKGSEPTTAVDLMEDDHTKAIQLAAVVFNFLAIALRLPDNRSRLLVLDTGLEQGKSLVEILRLHIFREDNVVFPTAHKLISKEEFDKFALLPIYGIGKKRIYSV